MADELQFQTDDGDDVGSIDLAALRDADADGGGGGDGGGGDGGTGPSATAERWRLVDVSEHGFPGDGSGGDLAQFLADRAGDVAFVLPAGTYRWERPLFFTGGDGEYDEPIPERFAVVGQPQATIEVDIESDDPKFRTCFWFGTTRSPMPFVELRNLHVDVGDANPARDAGIMRASVNGMYSEDISISQRCRLNEDGSRNGDRHTYKCDVVDPEGTAIHRDIDLTAGDTHREDVAAVGHAIGFSAEPAHQGTNRWIDCAIAGYTDNGYYVRDGLGSNILEGCLARNCGGGHIRLGYNDVARDCRVVVDGSETPADGAGIWLQGPRNTRVEGCTIDGPAMDNDALRVTHGPGSWSMRNVEVELGDGVGEYALKASPSRSHSVDEHAPAAISGVSITDGCDGSIREAGLSLARPNVTVERLHYDATGGRIPLACRARGLRVADGTIRSHGAYAARLGSVLTGGEVADVVFDNVTFELDGANFGDDSQQGYLTATYNSPELHRLGLQYCDVLDSPAVCRGADPVEDFESYVAAPYNGTTGL